MKWDFQKEFLKLWLQSRCLFSVVCWLVALPWLLKQQSRRAQRFWEQAMQQDPALRSFQYYAVIIANRTVKHGQGVCVCVHINAKDFCSRRRWEKIFLPQEHLGCLQFYFRLRSATFSFQWLTWACLGTVLREKRRQRAQHGTRQVFLPQGKDRCQVFCDWGVPNCWKVRYGTGDRKLWQEEGRVVFSEIV